MGLKRRLQIIYRDGSPTGDVDVCFIDAEARVCRGREALQVGPDESVSSSLLAQAKRLDPWVSFERFLDTLRFEKFGKEIMADDNRPFRNRARKKVC